jgi:hypothetical protein
MENEYKFEKIKIENFEVITRVFGYPDLRVNFYALPEQLISQELLKIKNDLKIRKYAHFDKKASGHLLFLELYFFFLGRDLSKKSPKELIKMAHPDMGIRRYYPEIRDTFFDNFQSIHKKENIDKADIIARGWPVKSISEAMRLIDELGIKNLRKINFTPEQIKISYDTKAKRRLLKILGEFIDEKISSGIEARDKIWKKYYQRIFRHNLSPYLYFIKREAENIFTRYYSEIVSDFISKIKSQITKKELKIFKLYYAPLDILGNRILYLHHNAYFNGKDFDNNIMPILIASRVFNIKEIKGKNIERLIKRAALALLAALYSRKCLMRQDEKEKKRIQRENL